MICSVALHEQVPDSVASQETKGFRERIKGQPGFVGGYYTQDSKTRRMAPITVWDSEEGLAALKERTPPGGPAWITTDLEELFDVVGES
jgi:hypothetical protein